MYADIYVECIARNPLYQHKLNEPINCPPFIAKLEAYLFAAVARPGLLSPAASSGSSPYISPAYSSKDKS